MTLEEWLMHNYGAEKFAPGLERVRAFVSCYLEQIQKTKPLIITIAGTNGKGQTALSITRHLKHNLQSFALWTSPHIERVTERFIDREGEIASDLLKELLEYEAERARSLAVGLSYYEILWAAFLRWVSLRPVNYLVLEVGLGGRLDAVNLLEADFVALTSISRDHQEFLGSRLDNILQEKLGVLRKKSCLVSNLSSQYLNERVQKHSDCVGYQWLNLRSLIKSDSGSDFWSENERVAEAIVGLMGFKPAASVQSYKARGESQLYQGHEFIFYGSHNPDGARKLIQLLQHKTYNFKEFKIDQVWVAMSQRSEKDLLVMAKIFSQFGLWEVPVSFSLFDHPKAAVKGAWWQSTKAQYFEDWRTLFQQLSPHVHQKILVTGSYYFVAELKHHLTQGRGAVPTR